LLLQHDTTETAIVTWVETAAVNSTAQERRAGSSHVSHDSNR
jgi:hypothetical protein